MSDILYLSEKDVIESGVLNAELCIKSAADSFALLSKGDYLMGGIRGHAHGMLLVFPEVSDIPNYPVNNGNDHRFTAMPAYAGGRFHCVGMKWISSNTDNPMLRGIPRANSFILLSDPESGVVYSAMSGTLVSTMRSAAGAAVAVRYLGKKTRTLSLIGAGAMNKASLLLFPSLMPELSCIKVYDIVSEKSEQFYREVKEEMGLEVKIAESMEDAFTDADTIHLGQSKSFLLEEKLVKPGALVLISSVCSIDEELITGSNIYMDQLKTHEIWHEDDKSMIIPTFEVLEEVDKGTIRREDIVDIGTIHDGSRHIHQNGKVNLFYWMGMPLMDVALAYDIYSSAKNYGKGTLLQL